MPTITRFEDILSWKKARELTYLVYEATNQDRFSRDYALKDQVRRASLSIMLNIAEGFARKTDRDFAHFLAQAHGSTAEVQAAVYVALDQAYLQEEQFQDLYDKAEECSRLIQSFGKYLGGSSSR
ncbi:MAG: four helix bundle protein [Blastocatellia bacterium]|nr:four helix bundle protein [Blastocatellia bacterium]